MPEHFNAPSYNLIQPHLRLFVALSMVGGLSALLQLRYSLSGGARVMTAILSALPVLVLSGIMARAEVWTVSVQCGALAVCLMLSPFRTPVVRSPAETAYDLGALILSPVVGVTGLLRLTAILEATTDFVAIFHANGPGIWHNHAARRLIGLDENELIPDRRMGQAQPEWCSTI